MSQETHHRYHRDMVDSAINILHITDLHVGSVLGDNIWKWTKGPPRDYPAVGA